jgi:hypothetical protein
MVRHGYSNAINVFHNVAFWGMKRHQAPQRVFVHYTTRIPRVTSRFIQWNIVVSTWRVRGFIEIWHPGRICYKSSLLWTCDITVLQNGLRLSDYVKPEHQWADSIAESAHLVDSARSVHIQHQNEALIKISKIHPSCYLCTEIFYNFFFFCFFATFPL